MTDTSNKDEIELLPAPNMVNLHIGQAWSVITPYVYRYEDQQWIDEFFQIGKLRLSTFDKFASYPDEVRGDTNEGKAICTGVSPKGHTIIVAQQQGSNCAVLSCSHRLDHGLREAFGRDGAFQIANTFGFALEVSRQIPGFRNGIEGSCIYRSESLIRRKIDFDMNKYQREDGAFDMQMLFDAGQALGGPELLLLKRKIYENQQEYRIAWAMDSIGDDYVDVVAPLARQYCRKIRSEEWIS